MRSCTASAAALDVSAAESPSGSARHRLRPTPPRLRRLRQGRTPRPGTYAVAVAVGGDVPVAGRGAQKPREVDPGAAAQHAKAALAGDPWRTVGRGADVPRVPAVLDPHPHVAVHVVQAVRVRRERTDGRRSLEVPPASTATAVCPVLPDLVAPVVFRRRPGTRRVLPLGLARQPVARPSAPTARRRSPAPRSTTR